MLTQLRITVGISSVWGFGFGIRSRFRFISAFRSGFNVSFDGVLAARHYGTPAWCAKKFAYSMIMQANDTLPCFAESLLDENASK